MGNGWYWQIEDSLYYVIREMSKKGYVLYLAEKMPDGAILFTPVDSESTFLTYSDAETAGRHYINIEKENKK